jgi:hypothetical protein
MDASRDGRDWDLRLRRFSARTVGVPKGPTLDLISVYQR